jgi:sugar phosphate isomerase/epimerase
MKIGLVTDSLAHLPLPDLLDTAAAMGITMLEFGCGNWSRAPHIDLDEMLASEESRRHFLAELAARDLSLSALNCSGNPLHPRDSGEHHREVTSKTIRLAGLLGVPRVVMMSGLPGGGPWDETANWITTAWPPETATALEWQWSERILPYWHDLVREAQGEGVGKLCLEMHGHQAVYNVATLLRLRAAVGPVVGANFDPSHLMWMGADPIAAVRALGGAIYHVHAKDTRIDAANAAVNSLIDTTPMAELGARAWGYVTLGFGHGESWWREFCIALRLAGYDDVLSIEHEDLLLPPEEGVRRSVALLKAVANIG